MKEYEIKITGEYDVIVLSPKMVALLIDKIRDSDKKEMIIPAKEILPKGYAEYLNCVLHANTEIAKTLPDRSAYTLIAEQIETMQCNETHCFERVDVAKLNCNPQLDLEAKEEFYILTKQLDSVFRYVMQNEYEEEISIIIIGE